MPQPSRCWRVGSGSPAALRPLDGRGRGPQFCGMDQIVSLKHARVSRFAAPDPGDCRDMNGVRAGVDEVDRLLVALIARRQGYMDAAARIKQSRDVVRDEARIGEVLSKVKAEAERQGLSWLIAEPVWRELMERCIAYEFVVWDKTRAPAAPRG